MDKHSCQLFIMIFCLSNQIFSYLVTLVFHSFIIIFCRRFRSRSDQSLSQVFNNPVAHLYVICATQDKHIFGVTMRENDEFRCFPRILHLRNNSSLRIPKFISVQVLNKCMQNKISKNSIIIPFSSLLPLKFLKSSSWLKDTDMLNFIDEHKYI